MTAFLTHWTRWGKRLSASDGGLYVVDAQRRMVVASPAVGRWLGIDAATLVGQECRYHGGNDSSDIASLAARLCPPPALFFDQPQTTQVTITAESVGEPPHERCVHFYPLLTASGELELVLAIVAASAVPDAPRAAPGELDAAECHRLLERYRRAARHRYQLTGLVGESPHARRLRAQVKLASTGNTSALIVGPPGSGRQHVAKAIHYGGEPALLGPLVPLACPLLGPELLQNSIRMLARSAVGHDSAHRGTLLLNDVDQLSAVAQAELLGFLQHAELPLRLIGTARRKLMALARRGRYSIELAYALSALVIEVPPLSDRVADIPLLAQWFLEELNAAGDKQVGGFSPEALERLMLYRWPGELDELAAVVGELHAKTLSATLSSPELPERFHLSAANVAESRAPEPIVLEGFLAQIERELIQRAIRLAKGNKARAARLLGLTRPRLYRRLEHLGLLDESPGEP